MPNLKNTNLFCLPKKYRFANYCHLKPLTNVVKYLESVLKKTDNLAPHP